MYAVERLAQRVKDEGLEVICVPSSFQAKQLIIQHGLKLGDLEMHPEVYIHFYFHIVHTLHWTKNFPVESHN